MEGSRNDKNIRDTRDSRNMKDIQDIKESEGESRLDGKAVLAGLGARVGGLAKGKNGARLLIALGLAGMLLVAFSRCGAPAQQAQTAPPAAGQEDDSGTADEYVTQLEQRLGDVVSSISGVGRSKLLITLERGAQNVYAQEQKQSSDSDEQFQDSVIQSSRQNESREDSYLLVEDDKGRRQALLTTSLEPEVKGVVVVCQGADSPRVVAQVVEAVTTALGISSNRVCVVKLGSEIG